MARSNTPITLVTDSAIDVAQRLAAKLLHHEPTPRGWLYDPGPGLVEQAKDCPCNDCDDKGSCVEECERFLLYLEGPAQKRKAKPRPRYEAVAICPHCQLLFLKQRRNTMYCSPKCNKQASALRVRKRHSKPEISHPDHTHAGVQAG